MNVFPNGRELEEHLSPFLRERDGERSVSAEGIRTLARKLQMPERNVMMKLLELGVWPERFSRCRGVFTAGALIRMLSAKILVAGCGGLGGHVTDLLARMGTGSLVLCDPDIFEESNLNRQHFCTEKTLGKLKAEACRDGLLNIASYMDIEVHAVALDEENLPLLLKGTDAVMDCLDSIARKKMLEKAAREAGVPCVQGSVARNEGLALFDLSGRLPFSHVYPGEDAGNREGAPMNTHALTVAGTACLMVSLLMRRLCLDKNDDGKLFHLDLSVPELEKLEFFSRP